MNDKTLLTIDVSHGTTHDGPGMRTTVFVKGCSLRCRCFYGISDVLCPIAWPVFFWKAPYR